MAVYVTPVESTLRLTVQTGTDSLGNPSYSRINLSGVKATATDQDVYDVAVVLADLQVNSLVAVDRSLLSTLTVN